VTHLSFHICAHARLIHTQTFCYCVDVHTGATFLVPRYNLSEVITIHYCHQCHVKGLIRKEDDINVPFGLLGGRSARDKAGGRRESLLAPDDDQEEDAKLEVKLEVLWMP
jgi:hypothetical protein